MVYSKLLATGRYLPDKVLKNTDIEKQVDTSDEWIIERTGIEQRHVAAEDETSASMGAIAAQLALEQAQLEAQDIELIVVATCTPDQVFPSTACLIQQRLGARECIAFDVSAACAGFMYALSVADQYIKTGTVKTALVIGSEVMSRVIDWSDRGTCILFGDGAGAFVLQADEQPGLKALKLRANGEYRDLLYVPNCLPGMDNTNAYLRMKGREIFKLAVKMMAGLAEEVLNETQVKPVEIDWIIPHQANLRIIHAIAKQLKFPVEKVITTVQRHANTSSASIPLAMDEAIRAGTIKRGDKIIFQGFGGGLTWGAGLAYF